MEKVKLNCDYNEKQGLGPVTHLTNLFGSRKCVVGISFIPLHSHYNISYNHKVCTIQIFVLNNK